MKTFSTKTRWATYPGCKLVLREYANNKHVSVSIVSETEGPIANLTVNLPFTDHFGSSYAFLDTNNFPDGERLVEELGIAESVGFSAPSGFCSYPLYRFDLDKAKEYA